MAKCQLYHSSFIIESFIQFCILPKGGAFSQPTFFGIEWNSLIWNYYGRGDIWPNRKFLSSFIWILLHIEPKRPYKSQHFQINNLHSKSQPEMVIFSGYLSLLLNCISNTINNLHNKSQPEMVIFSEHISLLINCISNSIFVLS